LNVKKYCIIFIFATPVSLCYGQGDTLHSKSRFYFNASVGFVSPELSFGIAPGFYDNNLNNFGQDGYAETGIGASLSATYLSDNTPLGLTCLANYYYNGLSTDSYVAQVDNFRLNHFRAMGGTGYRQMGILGGVTLSTLGRESWIDLKILAGFMFCSSPYVADSGHVDNYAGTLIPNGPDIIQPSNKLVPAWGLGIEVRPCLLKHVLFLFNTDFIITKPIFHTSQQITYYNTGTNSNITLSTPYQYQLDITTLYVSIGIAIKMGN